MALRLILVSAVAGLGLSLPSGDDLSAWTLRVRNWMDASLSAWDQPTENEDGMLVFAAESTPAKPTPAPVPPAIQAEENDPDVDPVPDETTASLATGQTPDGPAPNVAPLAGARAAQAPRFEPMEVGDDLYPGLAFALNREAEGIGIIPPEVAAHARAGSFEPMELGDDLYPGLAFALNREAEGIRIASPAPGASRGEQWAQAIRLTREAAFAWANLLHGPAVVTIEH